MTVLEFDCVTGLYADPNVGGSAAAAVHDFTDAEHGYELQIDVEDTDDDGTLTWSQQLMGSKAESATQPVFSGFKLGHREYIALGNYRGASITISDVNGDGNMDFFIPTELTLTRLQDSSSEPDIHDSQNLRELNRRDHSV